MSLVLRAVSLNVLLKSFIDIMYENQDSAKRGN